MRIQKFCTKHGMYEAEQSVIFGKHFETSCPLCDAESEQNDAADKVREQKEKDIARYKKMNIEPEFYNASLDNYITDSESQKKALKAFIKMVEQKKGKILLLGNNGAGKTHLISATCKKLNGVIYTMYEISVMIRQAYTVLAKESEFDIVSRLTNVPFLAIDEIGRTKGSDAEQNWLSHIIDKRHQRFLPTVLNSNKLPSRYLPKEKQNEAIENYFDTDIMSRFQQDTEIIIMNDCKDRRKNS